MLHAARWKCRTQKIAKNWLSGHHRTTLSGYVFATKACIDNRKRNLLNSNISSTYPHNMVNFGPLPAEICWRVWGTPGNFNRFRVLALLLQRRRSTEIRQILQDVWSSPGVVHYRGRQLYSAGRPSRWASAHILVSSYFFIRTSVSTSLLP